MKKILLLFVTSIIISQSACFLDTKKDNNNSLLLLLLIANNPGNTAVTGVSLNKTTTSISLNNTEQLVATIAPANSTNHNITWSSSDDTVATVSTDGLVTAKVTGTAIITATTVDGSFTASCSVTVVFKSKTTGYDDSDIVTYCIESTYPSAAVYLQSLKTDINSQFYPTSSEIIVFMGPITSKWSMGIGTDGKWFTSDDSFLQYMELRSVSSTVSRYIYYSNFTGTVANYYEYQFDSSGRIIKRTYYNGAGTDGTWFTGDDVKAKDPDVCITDVTWSDDDNCTAVGYDTNGTTVTRQYSAKRDSVANTITYKMFQADGVTQLNAMVYDYTNNKAISYSTNMSTVISYSTYTLNSSTEKITQTYYSNSGVDTTWFTPDDTVWIYSESTYDTNGYSTGGELYTSPAKTTRMGYYIDTY